MTLYEINGAIRETLDALYNSVDEDGCIEGGAETLEALEALTEAREAKIEAIALYIKELDAETAAVKAEADKLSKRAKSTERKADRLREYLKANLLEAGERSFSTSRCKLSFRQSTVVELTEGVELPEKYTTVKTTVSPDKKAIKVALDAGEAIDGAQLVTKDNLQIK